MESLDVLHIEQFEGEGKALNFYCNDFKSHLNDHFHAISGPHKHDFFLTVMFTGGRGTHHVDFRSYPIVPGSVFIMSPGQVHSWEFSDDIDGFIFFHSQEFYDKHYAGRSVYQFPFFYSTNQRPLINLKKTQLQKLIGICSEMQQEYLQKEDYAAQKLVALVDLLYLNLSRWYIREFEHETYGSGGYSVKMRELARLVDEHFMANKSAAYYAGKMNITTKHLNRVVRATLDKTTSDMILDRVMLEAKRKLVHEEGNLSQIAYGLGYEDYAYFSKFFKARTGFTPKEFRVKYRGPEN